MKELKETPDVEIKFNEGKITVLYGGNEVKDCTGVILTKDEAGRPTVIITIKPHTITLGGDLEIAIN